MESLEAISVNLTTEELAVLLEELGAEEYAGLDTGSLDALSEREREVALDVARRGLIARRALIEDESGSWQVGQYPLAAVGISLNPARSVMVLRGQSRDEADSFLFHTDQDVYVTHQVGEHGTHQFLIMRDGETWQESILSAAGLTDDGNQREAPGGAAATVQAESLNAAFEEAQSGSAIKAAAMLAQQGVDHATAKSLAETLTEEVIFATIIAMAHRPEEHQGNMTLMSGTKGCWALEVQDGDETLFDVTPLALDQARNRLAELIS